MSRGLWFAAGAGAGVYAVVRARRAAELLTAEGLGDRLAAAGVGLRIFRDEVAAGRSEKEHELRRAHPRALAAPGAGESFGPAPRTPTTRGLAPRTPTTDEEGST